MGAAKFPEQIEERTQAGLRAAEDDRSSDPLIEALKAKPVNRKIVPEERNVRRALSPSARKGQKTIAKKMIFETRLKAASSVIRRLKAEVDELKEYRKLASKQIEILQRLAKQQAKEIETLRASKIRKK